MTIKHQNKKIFAGYLFALGATIIWSGNFLIARGLHENIPPITLAFFRWLVAVVIFLPFAYKALITEWNSLKNNTSYLLITALFGVSIFNTLIYFSAHTTTAINLSLIAITFPIFIIILARFFYGELISIGKGIGILLVTTGVLLLITNGDYSIILNISFAIGDIWMLIAAFVFAIYSLLIKRKPKELSIKAFLLSTFILGLIFLLPFYIWENKTTPAVIFDSKIILSIFYVGIFASLIAFIFWNKAVNELGPAKAGMIYYTLPVFSGFIAYIFLNEEIRSLDFYSMFLIVSGIIIANRERKT